MSAFGDIKLDVRAVSPSDVSARLNRLENDPLALRAWAWVTIEAQVRRERRWKLQASGLGHRGLGTDTFLDFVIRWTFLGFMGLYTMHKQAKAEVDKTFS